MCTCAVYSNNLLSPFSRFFLQCVTVLVAVLLSLSPQGTQTQAPGDEHDGCVRGTYNKGVKPLMDTRNYEQLLGVDKAVWYATDFDDNNNNHIFGDVTSVSV